MSLHGLSPELLALVMQAVEQPRDLRALIGASTVCFHIFSLSPTLFLSAVLKNAIPPAAHRTAAALLYIPELDVKASHAQNVEKRLAFVDQYFQDDTVFEFPRTKKDKPTMVALCRMYSQISYFVHDFSAQAMRRLDAHQTPPVLSQTERARFFRAFFRHELYWRVFPSYQGERHCSLVSPPVQFKQFLARMEPWEVEEISSVHEYFNYLVWDFFLDLEDQFMDTVLALPGARIPRGTYRPDLEGKPKLTKPAHQYALSQVVDDANMISFFYLEIYVLMFSSVYRPSSSITCNRRVASAGVDCMYRLVMSDIDQCKEIFQKNYQIRKFLAEALECGPQNQGGAPETVIPDGVDDNQPSHGNLGFYLFKHAKQDLYLKLPSGHLIWDDRDNLVRERGFVFWDADRIRCPAVFENLQHPRYEGNTKKDVLFHGYETTVEDRFEDVEVPMVQMQRLVQEFDFHEPPEEEPYGQFPPLGSGLAQRAVLLQTSWDMDNRHDAGRKQKRPFS